MSGKRRPPIGFRSRLMPLKRALPQSVAKGNVKSMSAIILQRSIKAFLGQCFYYSHSLSSALGSKLGWEWLIYNPLVRICFERAAQRGAPKVADAVLREFPAARSLADVGCGTGGFAAEFQRRGLRVFGCEYSARSRRGAQRKQVEVLPFDLSGDCPPLPGRPYDLIMTLEVAEHIPAAFADAFVDYLCATGDLLVFTAAPPGQGGHGHINLQPKAYWIGKFKRAGFHVDDAATQRVAQHLRELQAFSYLYNNLLILRRDS